MRLQRKIVFSLMILLLILFNTSCATMYKMEQPGDFQDIGLKKGESITVTVKDGSINEFTIGNIDENYLYDDALEKKVRIEDIEKIKRQEIGKGIYYFLSLILFSLFFSG